MHAIARAGSGPAVLCLHGYCQSSAYWAPTVERVAAQGIAAMAVDLPGFGASASEPGPYTMEALADAVAAFMGERGLGRATVVGGSMGGVVAQHLALRHPAAVGRLLLVATGAFTADPAAALAKAEAIAAAPWTQDAVVPIVDGFFFQRPPPEAIARYRAIAAGAAHAAAIEAARSNALARSFERLAEIAVPTLIVQGRHDRARSPEHGALMRDRIAGARLAIIEEAGHTPQLEQPEAFHAIALPFLLEGRSAPLRRTPVG